MTLNHIETLKTSIYIVEHTRNIKIHDQIHNNFKMFKNPYFSKKK